MISCVSLEWDRPVVSFCPLSPASAPALRTDLTAGERVGVRGPSHRFC